MIPHPRACAVLIAGLVTVPAAVTFAAPAPMTTAKICPNGVVVFDTICPSLPRVCPDGSTAFPGQSCPKTADAKCTAAKQKAQEKLRTVIAAIALKYYLTGKQAKVQKALDLATQKFNDAYLKAEAKAEAAGTTCPSTDDAEMAILQATETVNATIAPVTGARFADNGDETVVDRATGLQWELKSPKDGAPNYADPRDPDNYYTWGATVAPFAPDGTAFMDFLPKLNGGAGTCFAGKCDWRLPSYEEQHTIMLGRFPCPTIPCIDPIFGPRDDASFWSATTDQAFPAKARAVSFTDGYDLDSLDKVLALKVRAVRTVPPRAVKSVLCGLSSKCVFLTSTTQTGDLGGLAGADAVCNGLAALAQMPGTYVAWLSDGTTNALTRVTSNGPYTTRSGDPVANTLPELTDGTVTTAINEDENGTLVGPQKVWTGTSTTGMALASTCSDWTSATASVSGAAGDAAATGATWTELGAETCDQPLAFYCIEL